MCFCHGWKINRKGVSPFRHSAILCPVIPDPSVMFKEMMSGNKEHKVFPNVSCFAHLEKKNVFSLSIEAANHFIFLKYFLSTVFSAHLHSVLLFFLEHIRRSVHTSARVHRTMQNYSCVRKQWTQRKSLTCSFAQQSPLWCRKIHPRQNKCSRNGKGFFFFSLWN